MAAWNPITLFAAFVQTLRFMLQKHLEATRLSTGGATFARFVFSAPLPVGGVWHRRLVHRAAGRGLASGLLFAVSATGDRGATLALGLLTASSLILLLTL